MKMKRTLSIPLTLLVCLVPLGAQVTAAEADPLLMSDRGQEIRAQEFRQDWLALPPAEQTRIRAEGKAELLLRQLMRRKHMAAEAERRGLDKTPRIQAKLEEARLDILARALRDQVEAELPLPDFTALAQERYATRQSELTTQGEYQVAHILLRVTCEAERAAKLAKIQDLKAQLAAGGDFAELARGHSEDASATSGGELGGWLTADQLDPDFAAVLAQLPDGGISDPVPTRYGYHLIQRLAFRPAGVKPFAEVQEQLEQEIRAAYVRTRLGEAQNTFNPSPAAQVDQAALEALLVELDKAP